MSDLSKLPDPCEGPYPQMGLLIREEAARHRDILNDLVDEFPLLASEAAKTPEDQLADLEHGIRISIAFGWARALPDWSAMVHLNPTMLDPETGKATFEPWSADLFRIRMGAEIGMRAVTDAYRDGKYTGVPEAKGGDEKRTKRGQPVVVIDDTDHPGPVH